MCARFVIIVSGLLLIKHFGLNSLFPFIRIYGRYWDFSERGCHIDKHFARANLMICKKKSEEGLQKGREEKGTHSFVSLVG
jgi:hypothetical protein